jgi:hypothetical protein
LDDPAALPTPEETRVRAIGTRRFQCAPVDSARATYVIEQIDAAMAVLRLDPGEDAGCEVQAPLSALRALVIDVADELDAADGANRAIPHLPNAAASLSDALAVVRS